MQQNNVLEGYAPNDRWGAEDNDCVVCAVASVTDILYSEVHGWMKANGRRDKKGVNTYRMFGLWKKALGHCFTYMEIKPLPGYKTTTLRRFALTHPKGKYLVTIPGHAICVIDGIVVESNRRARLRSPVRNVWRVEKIQP
jgi:hypothetical protein